MHLISDKGRRYENWPNFIPLVAPNEMTSYALYSCIGLPNNCCVRWHVIAIGSSESDLLCNRRGFAFIGRERERERERESVWVEQVGLAVRGGLLFWVMEVFINNGIALWAHIWTGTLQLNAVTFLSGKIYLVTLTVIGFFN